MTNMTRGKPVFVIFKFALPLMLGGILQQMFMIIDSVIVGRGVGIQALASLGAADWINWFLLWGIQGFTQGLSIPLSLHFGAEDFPGLRKTAAAVVELCLIAAVAVTAVSLLCITPALRLLRTESAILPGAQTYLRVLFSGSAAVLAYNMASSMLRALGDGGPPLAAILIASAVNIGLDLLFVLVFQWGIFGAALATVLAQVLAFLFCLRALRKMDIPKPEREDWRWDKSAAARLCRCSLPTALQNALIALGGMTVQFVLNGFGMLFVAGFTATNKLLGLLESTAVAFGQGMNTYMGQNRGAGNIRRIDEGMRSVLLLSLGFSLVLSAAALLWGRPVLSLFVSSGEADAEQVIEIAFRYLRTMAYMLLSLYLLHAYRSSLQGLGNTIIPMLSGLIEMVMRVGVALVLPAAIGQSGIFYTEVAAWAGADLLLIPYYLASQRRMKKRILLEYAPETAGTPRE